MIAAVEREFVEPAQLVALGGAFGADEPQPGVRPRDGVVPRIGRADHQCRPALVRRHHRIIGEHEAGARARKAGEHEPGQHRQKAHAGEDFDGGDHVPVIGLRVHVAVADRRQRLDGEIEQLQRIARAGVGDRLVAERIEERKHRIEDDENRRRAAEEHRPVDGHGPMIEIGPETLRQADRFDLAGTEPDEMGPGPFCCSSGFSQNAP